MSNDGKKEDINMLLQFHRLAIIDKSHTGDQPFIYRNENRNVQAIQTIANAIKECEFRNTV